MQRLDASQLPFPEHVKTPMGSWNFFKDFSLVQDTTSSECSIVYKHDIPGVKFEEKFELLDVIPADRDKHTAEHANNRTSSLHIIVSGIVKEPIIIEHDFSGNCYHNTQITLEAGAECTIIEKVSGKDFVSHLVEIVAEENSHSTYACLQSLDGTYVSQKDCRIERDASIDWFEVNANEQKTFSRVQSHLTGENANTKNLSMYLGKDDQLIDFGGRAYHIASNTDSKLFTKGVLGGKAHAIYEGVLDIGEHAPKSNAFQEENCLLMSPDAEVKASPMLYINNNDVKCSHAATAGRVDKEKLFYLQARGLSEEEAQKLLVKAFVWPVVEALKKSAQKEIIPLVEPIIDRFTGEANE